MRWSLLVIATLGSAVATGCSMSPSIVFRHKGWGAMDRAAFEMDCPAEELRVRDVGDMTVGVQGCGRRAVYRFDRMIGEWTAEPPAQCASTE